MDSLGSLQNMTEKTTVEEVEVDHELARPPYIHVRPDPGPVVYRIQLIEYCRQYWRAE